MYIETRNNHHIEAQLHSVSGYLIDVNGIVEGALNDCTMTYSGLTLTVNPGALLIKGKTIIIDQTNVTLTSNPFGATHFIYIDIDMGTNAVTIVPRTVYLGENTPQGDLFIDYLSAKYSILLGYASVDISHITNAWKEPSSYINPSSVVGNNYDDLLPIGSVLYYYNTANPNVLFEGTTWELINDGYYLSSGVNPVGQHLVGTYPVIPSDISNGYRVSTSTPGLDWVSHNHVVNSHTHTTNFAHTHTIDSHTHSEPSNLLKMSNVSTQNDSGSGASPSLNALTASGLSTSNSTNNSTPTVGTASGLNTGQASTNPVSSSVGGNQSHNHTLPINGYTVRAYRRIA